jgi:tetratricopeptide (TPR) repeat protein
MPDIDTAKPATQVDPRDGAATVVYDAFISYSHAKDKPLATALQSAMQRLGKPWYRRRALRLFRDDTSLSASPHLWPSIEHALGRSRFLILLASPEAAASSWVNKEVATWLDRNDLNTLLIALCEGELAWDEAVGDFSGSAAMPLPPALRGRFADEPFWIDVRPYRDGVSTRDARFVDLAVNFAATVRGMPKEDLLSQELRQQRLALRLAGSAVVLLLVLLALAGWQWQVAQVQRDRAEHTLVVATQTASGLLFDLEQKFSDVGVPATTVEGILARVRKLQEELTQGGETSPALRLSQVAALMESADSLLTLGDTRGALASARQARNIMQVLSAGARNRADYQFLLSAAAGKIGDVLVAQGDLVGALAAYRDSLGLIKVLTEQDPGNAEWQIVLSDGEDRVGNVLAAQGDLAGALATYRDSFAIRKAMTQKNHGNTEWRRDLSVSDSKIGDALVAQGDLTGALSTYRDGLTIVKELAATDPRNTLWQRDLSVSDGEIAEVLVAQGDFPGALTAYRDSLAITQALAQRDPGNMGWQHDLAVVTERVGNVLKAQGDLAAAVSAFRDRLKIAKALAEKDPNNLQWQRELSIADHMIANALVAQGDLTGALAADEDAVVAARKFYAAHPDAKEAKHELAQTLGGLSWALILCNRAQSALDCTDEALTLDPSLLFVRMNRAHALLLLDRFDEARTIYVADKDKPRDNGKTSADIVRDDFAEMRKFGINTSDMQRITALFARTAP